MVEWLPLPDLPPPEGDVLNVASFNMLAQTKVRRSIFHYASKRALKFAHRKQGLLRVFRELDADVLALQELDFFHEFFQEQLRELGYETAYVAGEGKLHGVGVAFRAAALELVGSERVELDDLAADAASDVEREELQRGNMGQLVALRVRASGRVLVVGNTHLYWNWRYRFTRVAQAALMLRRVVAFAEQHGTALAVLCGDYNGGPDSGFFRMLTTRDAGALRAALPAATLHTPADHYDPYVHYVQGPPEDAPRDEEGRYQPVLTDYGPEHAARRVAAVEALVAARAALPPVRSAHEAYTAVDPEMAALVAPCPAHGEREGAAEPDVSTDASCASEAAGAGADVDTAADGCTCAATPAREMLLTPHDSGVAVGRATKWRGHPPYSVWGPGFRATLDYVFLVGEPAVAPRVRALARIPGPERLSEQVGLPDDKHPSDHLPVACVLELV